MTRHTREAATSSTLLVWRTTRGCTTSSALEADVPSVSIDPIKFCPKALKPHLRLALSSSFQENDVPET